MASLYHLVSKIFEHQRISISEEAGVGGIRCNLVVEEQAPVVAVRHSKFAISESKPVEHFLLYLEVVVHQSVCLPFLFAIERCLEEFQGKSSLAKFLDYHILIRGVEIVMVLQGVVVVEILTFVEVGNSSVVVFRVDDGIVVSIILVRIAVDSKLA